MNFNNLYPELIQHVFSFLDFEKKLQLSSVCRKWFQLMFQDVKELRCLVFKQQVSNKRLCGNTRTVRREDDDGCTWRSNLDGLCALYHRAYGGYVKPWELLQLFPQLKKLFFTTDSLTVDMLESLEKYCSALECLHLTINHQPMSSDLDTSKMSIRLDNLLSLQVTYFDSQNTFESGPELKFLRRCPKLERVEISGITIGEECFKVIPSRVKLLSVKSSKDARLKKSQNVFELLCENVHNLDTLTWHVKYGIQGQHVAALSNLTVLDLDVNSSVEVPIFKYCKKLVSLTLSEFNADSLRSVDQRCVLPKLKYMSADTFIGKPASFTSLCPALEELRISYMVLVSLDHLTLGVRNIQTVRIKRAGVKNSKLANLCDEAYENVFFSENFHRMSHPSIFSILLLKGDTCEDFDMSAYDSSGKAAYIKGRNYDGRQRAQGCSIPQLITICEAWVTSIQEC